MDKETARQLLHQSMKSLVDVPDELVDQLFSICHLVQVKKRSVFVQAGDIPEIMGFNLNGVFRLFYVDEDGNDLTKGFSTAGRFVVSYSSMAQNRPSYFTIEALVDTHILQFSYRLWMRMMEKDIRWYVFLYKLVETVYIMKELREKSFLLDDATTRYLQFKKEYSQWENRIKLYQIASYIGITPEALSRIRKKLKLT